MITCCKDCPDRVVGCHGRCEKYKQARIEYDKQKAIMNSDRDIRIHRIEEMLKHKDELAKRRKMSAGYYKFRGR